MNQFFGEFLREFLHELWAFYRHETQQVGHITGCHGIGYI
jgi:hypothetical protein